VEENAEEWIRSSPPALCNTEDAAVLTQVLNDYDRETADFYRWKVVFTQEELSALIRERSGIDYGEIIALEPLERGTSGRIIRLKIIGTERVMTIGKELEIRRTLSPSHLYSSAFVVDAGEENEEGIPQQFTLTGAGWGHGVGLCQIGAAMMAEKGYRFDEILQHYFPGTQTDKKY
jgi:SpoIID/LytB domain protein